MTAATGPTAPYINGLSAAYRQAPHRSVGKPTDLVIELRSLRNAAVLRMFCRPSPATVES